MNTTEKSSKNIFEGASIPKTCLQLSLPLVFSLVITLIYNLADTFFVAQTNDTNIIAGVSLGAPVFTLLMAVGNIFGQGGSSLISRFMGQDDRVGMRHVSAFCFYTAIFSGLALTAVMLLFQTPLVYAIGANEETFAYASAYYRVLAIGAPAVLLSFIPSNLLRAEGLSKESMIGTVSGAIMNIVLDPVFIFFFGLGASGAAIATVIGYVFSDVFFIVITVKKSNCLSMRLKEMSVSAGNALQIFSIGIPAAITNLMQSISIILVNQFLLPYGNEKIAAMGIVLKVNMIALLLVTGFAFGGQPMFGYYYGAQDRKRLSELFRFSSSFILGLSVLLGAAVFLLAPVLLRTFTSNSGILEDSVRMLRLQVVSIPFVALTMLLTTIFQALGKSMGAFILSISRQGVIFLVVLFLCKTIAGYPGILSAQAISDTITMAVAVVLFFRALYPELAPGNARLNAGAVML